MSDYRMPALGADMEAGTLVEWRVKPGDWVKSGDIIAVVETQKGAIEVEIFQDGFVSALVVPEGQRVPVGTVLAHIETTARPAPARPLVAEQKVSPFPPAFVSRPVSQDKPCVSPEPGRIKITPAARRLNAKLMIELSGVQGTGVDGSITLADLAAAAPSPAPPSVRRGLDLTEMRKAIAAAMSRSKREIPHYYLSETVDLGSALSWLERFNAERTPPERVLPAVLFLKAAALSLHDWPQLNGTCEDGVFHPSSSVHVGWAVALRGGGLIAPAIRDADKKTLAELMAAMRGVVERARRGGLRSSEITSPTMTVTSVGDRGSETVTGVIYPPQVAIVGFGRIVMRPWIVEGRPECRPLVNISLAADHRVTDGHIGGLYLASVADRLQEPEKL